MPLLNYPTAASPRRRLSAIVTPAQRPSTPQGQGWGDVNQWASQVVEKIRVASATGRVRFLPWYDPYTEETPEIRAEYRKMLTESSVKAAFQTKILSVISLDVTVQPADDDDPRQQQAAQFLTYAFRKIKGGMRRVGWSVLHPAVIDGHSVCEKVWNPQVEQSGPWRGKRIYRAVKAKDTRLLQLGIDPFRNVTGIKGFGYNAGRMWSPEDFIIFSYLELFENPAGTSDFRAAYQPYWTKHTVRQLWQLHLDKFTGPYLKGTYTNQDQKDALETALTNARATTWTTVPMGCMIDAIDLSMKGAADFESAIKNCDKEILIAIVGAHLQILEGQTSGARGNTKVHKETSELIQWFLAASLADIYRDQLASSLVEENFSGVETPDVSVGAVTEEAMLDYLKVDDGLQKLGWKLSRRDVGKRYSRPWPEPDDVLAAPAAPAAPPGGGPAAPASPFSETADFCTEGENKGKPGPCPEEKDKAGHAAIVARRIQALYGTSFGFSVGTPGAADSAMEAVATGISGMLNERLAKPGESVVPVWNAKTKVQQFWHVRADGAIDSVAASVYRRKDGRTALETGGARKTLTADSTPQDAAATLAKMLRLRKGPASFGLSAGAPAGGPSGAAGPFSETVDFCTEGENKGKPGPCPEGKSGSGAATIAQPASSGGAAALRSAPSYQDYAAARGKLAVAESDFKSADHEQAPALKAKLDEARAKLSDHARRAFLQTNKLPHEQAIEPRFTEVGRITAKKRKEVQQARTFIGFVLNKDAHKGETEVLLDNARKGGRAYYQSAVVHLGPNDDASVACHEFGHHLEKQPWVQERLRAFEAKRFGDEPAIKMSDKFYGFGKGETGRKDDLEKLFPNDPASAYYAGKQYPGQPHTEILSMGMELLYKDPVFFAETDPEYFNLVTGILRGEGRAG